PKHGTAVADLARAQIEKHQLIEKLGPIGGRQGEYAQVEVDQQLRAIQLLLGYGYGPPRAEFERNEGVVIEVTYVQTNQIAIAGFAPGAVASDRTSQTVQPGLLRAPLGQDAAGDGSPDSPGAER